MWRRLQSAGSRLFSTRRAQKSLRTSVGGPAFPSRDREGAVRELTAILRKSRYLLRRQERLFSTRPAEMSLRTPDAVEFAMSRVQADGRHYGHGWTPIHTDKTKPLLIRVNPCPSVAKPHLRSRAQSHSSQVPKPWGRPQQFGVSALQARAPCATSMSQ